MRPVGGWRLAACLLLGAPGFFAADAAWAADATDPDVARLVTALAALESDPALADKAGLERFKARQAVADLQAARSRDRGHALILADAWVEAAQDAARAEVLLQQSLELDRERDQILIEASRRDAEMARREADRLRLQSLARQEEAERLAATMEQERLAAEQSTENVQAQASQAMKLADARARETVLARKEAELAAAVAADSMEASAQPPPSRKSGRRTIYTLAGTAFASGSATVSGSAQASLRRMAAIIGANRSIRIDAHTDSQGADAANLALSRQRAEAIRDVLIGAGLPGARITAVGKGEASPVADNGSAEGRARNRRVEIVVE